MKIWFQNRRYKTKRRQLQDDTALSSARTVAVKVLVRDDDQRYHQLPVTVPLYQHYQYHPYVHYYYQPWSVDSASCGRMR